MKYQLLNLPSQQRGEGMTGIVAMVIVAVMALKLGVAIVPAQITDYQLTKAIANELKKSNDNKETKQQLLSGIQSQLKINGQYDMDLESMYTITGNPGKFKMTKDYEVESNFLPNVFITNRFQGEIKPAGSE